MALGGLYKTHTYKMQTNLNFGQALDAVKQGKLISREGWNGKGMFVFQRPADEIQISAIPNIKSLPQSVKDFVANISASQTSVIPFTAYLCMKAADQSIVNGWLASQTDMLANDWCILD